CLGPHASREIAEYTQLSKRCTAVMTHATSLMKTSRSEAHTIAALTDQDAKPSFSMSHLDGSNGPGLSLGGYYCPQCHAKYTELPVECKVCGLTLVSAPHLARSFHHLFPLQTFAESPVEELKGERFCKACQGRLKDKSVFNCPSCHSVFCLECDIFIHDSLHCCPCCAHCNSVP
ncbi:unnamed protein product, partial [Pleuronectes platessa]